MRHGFLSLAIVLLSACSRADESGSPQQTVSVDSLALASSDATWSKARPVFATASECEQDIPELTVLVDSSADGPSLLVQKFSIDTTGDGITALLTDFCGFGVSLVRLAAGGQPEFLPLPPGFVEGLTTFGFDRARRHIVFVAFDGRNGASAMVRSVPDFRLVAESERVAVPSGDSHCGFAAFERDSSWVAYVCTDDPNPQRMIRFRGRLGEGRISMDTTIVPGG